MTTNFLVRTDSQFFLIQQNAMSLTKSGPGKIIDAERNAYLEELPESDSDWPADVRAVYRKLTGCLFDMELEAKDVVADCGIGSNDIYSRFRHFTGHGIKEFVVYHRICLAKRLLRYESLSVTQIAFGVGYTSSSGFCKTFKRHVELSPTGFRKREEE